MSKFDTISRTIAAIACTLVVSSVFMLGAVGPATHFAASTIA